MNVKHFTATDCFLTPRFAKDITITRLKRKRRINRNSHTTLLTGVQLTHTDQSNLGKEFASADVNRIATATSNSVFEIRNYSQRCIKHCGWFPLFYIYQRVTTRNFFVRNTNKIQCTAISVIKCRNSFFVLLNFTNSNRLLCSYDNQFVADM